MRYVTLVVYPNEEGINRLNRLVNDLDREYSHPPVSIYIDTRTIFT